MRIEVKEDYPAGAAAMGTACVHRRSVKRKRTESFCGAKKSANTVYENEWGTSDVVC